MNSEYQSADWSGPSSGSMNFSVFIYRDRTNGAQFQLGDLPYAGGIVKLERDGEAIASVRSNIDGFANFTASIAQQDAIIREPGNYLTRVVPPPFSRMTSGNAEQAMRVVELPGAPGDLAMTTLPEPVGLAFDEIAMPSNRSDARNLRPTGDIVVFEDLISHGGVMKIPNNYHGLNWRNWVVTHNRFYGGPGYVNGTMVGEYVGYGGSGHPMEVWRTDPFDVVGCYVTAAWPQAEGELLRVRAWRGDRMVHERAIGLSVLRPQYLDLNFRDVTRVEFTTAHCWQVVVDALECRV